MVVDNTCRFVNELSISSLLFIRYEVVLCLPLNKVITTQKVPCSADSGVLKSNHEYMSIIAELFTCCCCFPHWTKLSVKLLLNGSSKTHLFFLIIPMLSSDKFVSR